MLYYFILLLIMNISLFAFMKENIYRKIGIPISISLIALFFIVFNSYGIDSARYSYFYDIIATRNDSLYFELSGGAVEKSFIAICMLCSVLKIGYIGVVSLYALLSFFFFYLITKELNLNKKSLFLWILSFLAFCLVPYLTVMRQFLASMIILYAVIKFQPTDWKKYIPLFILGFLFHHTVIILCPLIFIKNLKSKKHLINLPAACAVLNICSFWKLIGAIMTMLGIKIAAYVTKDMPSGSGILVLALYVLFVFSIMKLQQNNITLKPLQPLLLFGALFLSSYFLTKDIGTTARLSYFFYIFEAAPLILFYSYIEKKVVSKSNIVMIVLSAALIFLAIFNCARLAQSYGANIVSRISTIPIMEFA